jgi:soluble lytic murein transglycosylase-like protein
MAGLSIDQMIRNTANAAGVPPALAVQVATQESGLNPTALGSKGELGLFQLMPSTAASLGVTDPLDPVQNAQGGVAYLAQLFDQFGDWATALAAYNWGPGNVAKYGAAAAPASTQMYVASALSALGGAAPAPSTAVDNGGGDMIDASVLPDLTQTPAASAPGLSWVSLALLGLGVYFAATFLFGSEA